ncbi:MAG TPA: helicase, partial [Gammaproteobacteria bacterium]|nr:helicase [Gammaproteobacteria bacterium]
MRLVNNSGADRAIDLLTDASVKADALDLITTDLSLYAFKELKVSLAGISATRMVAPADDGCSRLLGSEADRPYRNQLQNHFLAKHFCQWLERQVELRHANGVIPQSMAILSDGSQNPFFGLLGAFAFTTNGLGITPGNPLGLIQATETIEEASQLSTWFEQQWGNLPQTKLSDSSLIQALREITEDRSPHTIYALILHSLFKDRNGSLDEDSIIKSATGIHQTTIWKKLYKFQKDAVVGAIDKLNRYGGCIIADSVGLGKTFEALAII